MIVEMSKAKRKAELEAAKRAIEEVARREKKTVAEVRADMTEAMMAGWNDPDPKVQAMWQQIPCEGERPTPEELIAWASRRVQSGMLS